MKHRLPLALVATLIGCGPPAKPLVQSSAPQGPAWRQRAVFYELWVRSFQDSNGDGIGDLKGLTQRLDYLAELGVGGLWLMPTFPSPLKDSGYDVADYQGVHPDYGTLEDMKTLLAEAHRRNLKVMLDLVFNHTSLAHAWFDESRRNPSGPKGDWFVWSAQKQAGCGPNLVFGDERWTMDPVRGQHYFHQFFPSQPDLNFRSASMREALKDVMRFWLELGVDGFRLDVAYKYADDPPVCTDHPDTFVFHREMRAVTDAYPDRVMVGEISGPTDKVLKYLGNGQDGLHQVFHFEGMTALWGAVKSGDAATLIASTQEAARLTPAGAARAPTLGNHDVFRTPTTVGTEPAQLALAATALLTLPGAPYVYYGEELGMQDGTQMIVDPRDFARTPMQWDDSTHAGFTQGTPFLPVTQNHRAVNVARLEKKEGSLLLHYKALIALRNRTPALQEGAFALLAQSDPSLFAFTRAHAAGDAVVVLNFHKSATKDVDVPLPSGWTAARDLLGGSPDGAVQGGRWVGRLGPRSALVLAP